MIDVNMLGTAGILIVGSFVTITGAFKTLNYYKPDTTSLKTFLNNDCWLSLFIMTSLVSTIMGRLLFALGYNIWSWGI
jgi:hypothetical protein